MSFSFPRGRSLRPLVPSLAPSARDIKSLVRGLPFTHRSHRYCHSDRGAGSLVRVLAVGPDIVARHHGEQQQPKENTNKDRQRRKGRLISERSDAERKD